LRIRGRFIGDAPYFAAHISGAGFHGLIWFLADTGASRTTLLDRDTRSLGILPEILTPAPVPIVGIGGSARTFLIRDVSFRFHAYDEEIELRQDLWVVQHDLERVPSEEAARILRLPSLLGRDLINQFRFASEYRSGIVDLSR
jgi:hypothetical protein